MYVEDSESRRSELLINIWLSFSQADLCPTCASLFFMAFILKKLGNFLASRIVLKASGTEEETAGTFQYRSVCNLWVFFNAYVKNMTNKVDVRAIIRMACLCQYEHHTWLNSRSKIVYVVACSHATHPALVLLTWLEAKSPREEYVLVHQ